MNDNPETSVNSAKALAAMHEKKAKELKQKEIASNLVTKLASDQVLLLKEANDLARQARIDAQASKEESKRSSKRAFWSNVIATGSLLIAIASLVLTFVVSST